MNLTNPVLCLRSVGKSFGDVPAVSDLSFEVHEREIVALIGPSGCGKTTTLRLVAGLEKPDHGSITIRGVAADKLSTHKRGVGMVFQDYALFPHLNVEDNVSFGLSGDKTERRRRALEVLEMVGLSDLGQRYPSELSGGQQQRVALARAIAPRPAIVLLDEPFSNLDPQLRRKVRHDLLDTIRSAGVAALWVTHDHDEGLIVADKVVVMSEGKAKQIGTPADIWHEPFDAWVASFIGNGDLLRGKVSSGRIKTSLGEVEAGSLAEGQDVQVLIRPEDVVIDPEGEAGTVVRRHFSGLDNIYCVQLRAGGLLHVKQPAGIEISRNTPVRVKLATDRLRVFS